MPISKQDKARLIALESAASTADCSPRARITAARDLLKATVDYRGRVTERVRRICRSVIHALENYSSASVGLQRSIRLEVEHLAADLERALEASAAQVKGQDDEAPEPAEEEETAAPVPPAPHQMIANPELAPSADFIESLDTDRFFDWHGLDGRTDLQPIIGKDLKDVTPNDPFKTLVPHPYILEKLLQLFEPELSEYRLDPYARARKIADLWYFPFTEKHINAAEQRLKTGPWLELIRNGDATELHLTSHGQQRRFLELLRARLNANLTVYGRQVVSNGSL